MAKPKKLDAYPEQDYPSLAEFTDRRGFLKRSVLGCLAATAAGSLLSGCQIYENKRGAGEPPMPDYHDVRLPIEGSANLYLYEGDYLTFAVTFITCDQAVADHYNNAVEDGLEVVYQVLRPLHCGEVIDGARLAQVEEALRLALEEHAANRVPTSGQGIAELTLLVDMCEDGMIAGGDPGPDYP